MTRMARSMVLITFKVRSMRFSPKSPESSIPAVSMTMAGPTPKISTDFFTGSVVVPAKSDTMATSCPTSMLMIELLPLFLLPKMPMCGFRSFPLDMTFKIKLKIQIPLTSLYFLYAKAYFRFQLRIGELADIFFNHFPAL